MAMFELTSEAALKSLAVVELLRSTGEKEFPAQLMSTFLFIAAHNGCRQTEVIKATRIAPSSVSRCITWLGPRHRLKHRSGLQLVRRVTDPDNYKARRLYLTPKGEEFLKAIELIMQPS